MKTCLVLASLMALMIGARPTEGADRPNVVFVLADDLAQGDLGCYGQSKIETPVLDRMAREGTRFTQAYSGTSVCAPSRTSLMIGQHTGHSPIRANREIQPEGQKPLPPNTYTVAQLFKSQGYATACTGKWGMGMFDTAGSPLKVGFDHFFGYNCQRHAHDYFPTYLYRDDQRIPLDGETYGDELIIGDTIDWIKAHRDQPFFVFHAATLPHGKYEIDDLGQYKDKDWTELQKTYAAMVTRFDSDMGRLFSALKEMGVDEKTLVIVAGDNGSSFPPNSEIGRMFDQAQGLRGFKRSLYEGGLRQACIARWPGQVPAGRVCDEPWAFWDFLPTCADLLGASLPSGVTTDGVSILPMLRGGPAPDRPYFYWELHESGPSLQAVRFGDWKAVKNAPSAEIELYNLEDDPGEQHDLAADRPRLVARAATLMDEAHTESPDWPMQDRPRRNAKARAKAN